MLPLSLFPLVALLTYDWHAIPSLINPPMPSSNWIGALGDGFAFYGYTLFGLAIWCVPVLSIVAVLFAIFGHRHRSLKRLLWLVVFLVSIASLLQATSANSSWTNSILKRINLANAGGATGYLLMTRCLSPMLNEFGSAILMIIIMIISLVAIIGIHEICVFFAAIANWALYASNKNNAHDNAEEPDPVREQYLAAQAAKNAAKLAAQEERERARAEKEAAKEAIIRAREEAMAARNAAEINPQPKPQPKPKEKPLPVVPVAEGDADKGPYVLPNTSLLNPLTKSKADHGDVEEMSSQLISTLRLFGIDATLAYNVQGPVVTKYAIHLAPGVKYSVVTNITDNLKGALRAKSLRIQAPIPGEDAIGIEVPNRAPAGISFREIIESDAWRGFKGELPLLFGKDAAGNELIGDLAAMPHMLVAGATGQGKSVCLNSIINGLLMTKTPEQLKLIMVDPKSVEFTAYASLPHLIVPVITDNKKVIFSLHWAVAEMERRLKMFARAKVRNIYDFNHRPQFTQTDMFGNDAEIGSSMPKTVPYIVIIIDEVADLMASNGKEVTPDISRLTAKARAAGIHLILATQRPDAKIITGTIKANIPGRVAFKTASAIDSRTILDDCGAENLIGRGDMLFKGKDGILVRAQGAWISDDEIARVTEFIAQHSNTDFDDRFNKKLASIKEEEYDPYKEDDESGESDANDAKAAREQIKADAASNDLKKAIECIINTKRASTSHFQRQMGWGYNHAAKILDLLAARGIVSAPQGMGPRQIIMDQDQLVAILNDSNGNDENTSEPTDSAPTTELEQTNLFQEDQL